MLIVLTGKPGSEWIMERKLEDSTWDKTVLAIAAGEWTDVSQIIQASTGIDVLPAMMHQVHDIWVEDGEPLNGWAIDLIEQHLGIPAAHKFREREAA